MCENTKNRKKLPHIQLSMYIKKIVIDGVHIDIESPINIFGGLNGVGKTTILKEIYNVLLNISNNNNTKHVNNVSLVKNDATYNLDGKNNNIILNDSDVVYISSNSLNLLNNYLKNQANIDDFFDMNNMIKLKKRTIGNA